LAIENIDRLTNPSPRKDEVLEHLIAILPQLPTLEEIVIWGGYIGLFAIIFAETGLLIGFFLPGDSLLVTAGLFAARGELSIFWLNILLIVAAVSGDAVGYSIGLRAGHALFNRLQSRWFRRDHLLKTKAFYDKYGGTTIVLARVYAVCMHIRSCRRRRRRDEVPPVRGFQYHGRDRMDNEHALHWVPSRQNGTGHRKEHRVCHRYSCFPLDPTDDRQVHSTQDKYRESPLILDMA